MDEQQRLEEALRSEYAAKSAIKLRLATDEEMATFPADVSNICHERAKLWVELHPGWRVVEGWLVVNEWMFNRHSVVARGDCYLCVTPRLSSDARCLREFIIHRPEWAPKPFARLRNQVL